MALWVLCQHLTSLCTAPVVTHGQVGQQVHHPVAKVPHWGSSFAGRARRVLRGLGSVRDTVGSGRVGRSLGDRVGALCPCHLLGRRLSVELVHQHGSEVERE